MMDEKKFYDTIRPILFKNSIIPKQFEGLSAILSKWKEVKFTDIRWLAYILATVYHETARTMQPIEEGTKGRGRRYGTKVKMSGIPYETPDKIYYGRGLVQITWYENYNKM